MKDLLFASEKPDSKSDEEWEFEHKQVCGYIRKKVEDNVVNHIANKTHSKGQGQNGRDKSKSKSRSKYKNLECHYYGKTGHIKKYCYKWKRENKPENSKQEKNDDGKHNDQVATVTSEHFFILYDDDVINVASQETSLVIDSGVSIHATSRNDLFTSYAASDFGTIKMGNDGLAKVIGIGDMCLEIDNGSSLLLRGVKHIPDIRLNLISMGRLDDEGYCNTFSDAFVHIHKDERFKLDMKTRQCIFIAYGLDEFGYRLYDPVKKKLVRSCDVMFMEDQSIKDVEKADKVVPQYNDGFIDLDPIPFTDLPTNVEHDV
ncbi:hypothetical protein Pint_20997 [Pistacia integerrima]|uniref:Uncharacterized protein n=1 Tax=Pistacia integerrima TaxID=434235 RepID=A0ACC0X7Z0_9ROSI|nr:hypothetical protein Pint_20997 [Pistacia integerrima]